MSEEVKHNHCYNCRHLRRYYVKGNIQFNQTDCGWCSEKCEIVNTKSGCDKFKYRPKVKRINMCLADALNELLMQMSLVRDLIAEEESEKQDV